MQRRVGDGARDGPTHREWDDFIQVAFGAEATFSQRIENSFRIAIEAFFTRCARVARYSVAAVLRQGHLQAVAAQARPNLAMGALTSSCPGSY